jgi:cytochrome c oxidase assembly protein subunit 15
LVDPHWLAAHLMTALFTLGGLVWTALDLQALDRGRPSARLTGFAAIVLATLAVQLFFGAEVAGMRAGVVAGSGWLNLDAWPLMQGRFFPQGVDWGQGPLAALLRDPYLVHFVHRWWAWVVVGMLVALARRLRARHRGASIAIHAAFGTQLMLGIATVWSGVAPGLAALHQLTGALLVAAAAWGAHALGRER